MPLIDTEKSYKDIVDEYESMTPMDLGEVKKITQKTISDLREDEDFLKNAEVALGWLGENITKPAEVAGFGGLDKDSDPIEAIRDSQWNTVGMGSLAWNINDAPDDVKEAWAYIREEYANADTRGLKENAGALWDIGIDLISDPATLGAILATPITLGGSAATNLTTRAGLMAASKAALGKLAGVASGEMTKSTVKNGVIAGAGYGLLDSQTRQHTDMAIGLQDNYSFLDLGLSTVAGGTLGGAAAKYLPQAIGAGAKGVREFFENANKDKAIARVGDDIDHPEPSTTYNPETETIVQKAEATFNNNNTFTRIRTSIIKQNAGKIDLTESQVDQVLTEILELKTKKEELSPEDTNLLNELQETFNISSKQIDDLVGNYDTWSVPKSFVNTFLNKWTPFSNIVDLTANRGINEENLIKDIGYLWRTSSDDILDMDSLSASPEGRAAVDILNKYDLDFNDYKELLDDVATFKTNNPEPTPEQIANRQLAEETASEIGGGDEIADQLEALYHGASKTTDPNKRKENLRKASSLIHRTAGTIYMGRPASRLKPYAKTSKAIRLFAQKLRYDTFYKDISNTQTTVERVGQDFHETKETLRAGWGSKLFSILDEAAFNYNGALSAHNQKIVVDAYRGAKITDEAFKNQDKSFRLNPLINDRLLNADTTKIIVGELKTLFSEMGTELLNRGIIKFLEPDYFPRMWDAVAVKNNKSQFVDLLYNDLKLTNKNITMDDATSIADNMLDNASDETFLTPEGSHFFYNRKLDITDESKFSEFLNQDLPFVLHSYIDVASRAIAKQDIFGVRNFRNVRNKNVKTFENTWLRTIEKELRDSGVSESEIQRLVKGKGTAGTEGYQPGEIEALWRHFTGEGAEQVENWKKNLQDGWTVAGRTALLPLITVTSVTEPIINIAKAGPKHALYGFVDSLGTVTKTIGVNFANKLAREYKYKPPEVWQELRETSSIMTTSMNQMSQRSGSRTLGTNLSKANYHFFRGVLIDQWTKFVQLTSHNTAKRLIKQNLTELYDAGITTKGDNLPTKRLQRQQAELLELDIDVEAGINWVKNGGNIKDDFWQKEIASNIPRYVREVIIPTEKSAGTTPMLHNNPKIGWLFDLMSYPAAFSNTVLAEFAGKVMRNKGETGVTASTLATLMIMTEVARYGNYVRTRGESEDFEDESEIIGEAWKRWGGFGPVEPVMRGLDAWKYSRNIASVGTALIGPTGSDISKIAQKGTFAEALGQTRVPGIQALRTLSPEKWERWVEYLGERDADIRDLAPELDPRYTRGGYEKGGIVENVPQVPEEPDERIDKMTGLPYNIQAGEAFIDEEDRLSFALGGKIGAKAGKIVSNFISTYTDDIAKNSEVPPSIMGAIDDDVPEVSKAIDEPTQSELPEVTNASTINPFESVPKPATYDEMFNALDVRKKEKINIEIPDGQKVGLRLDIPAYERYDTWVPTIHDEGGTKLTSHRATAAISDVDLSMSDALQRKAEKIKGGKAKSPFARIGGRLINRTDEENYRLAQKYLNDPEWTQVGYNPDRHSYFFDRSNPSKPVIAGEEAIQVGPLVLVKNAKFGSQADFRYATGGKVLGSLGRTCKSQGGKILSSLNKLKGAA